MAGDQLPTDGILAYWLGFTFLSYAPELTGVPFGPALMHRWGELVRPLLFRRSVTDRRLQSRITDDIAGVRIVGEGSADVDHVAAALA